jgi:hypothetical protein
MWQKISSVSGQHGIPQNFSFATNGQGVLKSEVMGNLH